MDQKRDLRDHYDIVIVGARCAGAATAMLLARAGLRVLLFDRSGYGTDALSTHALMRGGVHLLHEWGLASDITGAGTPAIKSAVFDYAGREVRVPIKPRGEVDSLYAPKRTLLDRVLVDAARAAGAQVEHGLSLVDLVWTGPGERRASGAVLADARGSSTEVHFDLLVGADGRRSKVASLTGAPLRSVAAHASAVLYTYAAPEGLAGDSFQWHWADRTAAGVIPTNDGETCVFVAAPERAMEERKARLGPEGTLLDLLRRAAPRVAATLVDARAIGTVRGFRAERGFIRDLWRDNVALVGDAASFHDPLTAHGITSAFRDAALLACSILEGPASMDRYRTLHAEIARPLLEVGANIASFAWDMDDLGRLHEALNVAMAAELRAIERLARPVAALSSRSVHLGGPSARHGDAELTVGAAH